MLDLVEAVLQVLLPLDEQEADRLCELEIIVDPSQARLKFCTRLSDGLDVGERVW